MAQEPIATKGNFLHIYDFRVKAGYEAEFIKSFEAFDYSDDNPMHKSSAQVKDGQLNLNMDDEIVRSTLVTQGGEIVNPRVREFFSLPALVTQS